MNKSERLILSVVGGILLLGMLIWMLRGCGSPKTSLPPTPVTVSTETVAVTPSTPTTGPTSAASQTSRPAKGASTTATGQPLPPKLDLRKDLIPKDITIVRCYYEQEVVPPGTSFGFDINGSGFNEAFQQMITVDAGHPGIRVKNLKLVTPNQIHGEMEIGDATTTAFVYPRILIKGQPVFSAPDPFAVIRNGEVLTVFFISMEENGRAGRFRVLTNLNHDQFSRFQVVTSTPDLTIDKVTPKLPYVVEGVLYIGPRLPPGDYGLHVQLGDKIIHRRDGMIRIVKPNVGASGFIQGLMVTEPFHRPGDVVQFYLQGSGFIPANTQDLKGEILGLETGPASFEYLNSTQMRMSVTIPAQAPVKAYSLKISNTQGVVLHEKKDAFQVIPANWIRGVQVTPPVKAGGSSTLKIIGRDLDASLAQNLKIDLDEAGIKITGLTWTDASSLTASIAVDAGVRPGDYWLQMSAGGKKISPPFGSIIKVEAP